MQFYGVVHSIIYYYYYYCIEMVFNFICWTNEFPIYFLHDSILIKLFAQSPAESPAQVVKVCRTQSEIS